MYSIRVLLSSRRKCYVKESKIYTILFILTYFFKRYFLAFNVVFHSTMHRNFHVWNELWTKRKDLPTVTYDGWQAIDSTPQETSFSLHQMGPAPLKAIKNGDLYIQYDVGFVFAEVNADYVKWIASKDASGNVVFKGKYRFFVLCQ